MAGIEPSQSCGVNVEKLNMPLKLGTGTGQQSHYKKWTCTVLH